MEEVRGLSVAGSFVDERWQALEGLPKRSGDVSTEDFSLCVGLPMPFTAAELYVELTHVVLTSTHVTGAKGSSGGSTGRSIQNAGYGLLRIHLLQASVNKPPVNAPELVAWHHGCCCQPGRERRRPGGKGSGHQVQCLRSASPCSSALAFGPVR
jgi:hypothetical protein